uniref:SLAM family member 9-like n=1 Tax=Geotrypetes seraphini TaxID=260995 RepID=A0A6P8PFG2_GEOSA|nr:SLAM family member 9-like [Geotrypetes seraphini]
MKTLIFLLIWGAGNSQDTEAPQDVFGILGESIIFPLEIPKELNVTKVFWITVKGATNIAFIKMGEKVDVLDPRFKGRVRVPDGNFSLEIQSLREEDGQSYNAQISTDTSSYKREFNLRLFSRLQKPKIHKIIVNPGNMTCSVTLNCTVEKEEGVNYTWTAENGSPSTGSILNVSLTLSASNDAYKCTAKNPVSENFTQITPWEVCARETPKISRHHFRIHVVTVSVVIVPIVLAVTGVLLYVWIKRNRKRKKQKMVPETQTIYAQVTKPERDTSPVLKEDASHANLNGKTLYCTVDFPKKKNSETEKSLYDTVKLPTSSASATYDKVM